MTTDQEPTAPRRIQRLFVYGSLAPGEANEHFLQAVEGSWEPGTVRGYLSESGWGFTLGYPALVLDPDGDEIEGMLFSSARLADSWEELDRFEGKTYQRVPTRVQARDSGIVEAYVYELRKS